MDKRTPKFQEGDLIENSTRLYINTRGRVIAVEGLRYKIFWISTEGERISDSDQFKLFGVELIEHFYMKAAR